jgi:putative hydrolase of the HAD superfamily
MVKVVIFDLDDTLISEKEYIKSGFRHIAGIIHCKYGMSINLAYRDLLRLFEANRKNVFNRLLDKYGIVYCDDIISDLVYEYRNHYPQLKLYDDVIPCLEYLKSKQIQTGIVTDGYEISQKRKLDAIKVRDYFDCIIVTDELGQEFWKPHPKAFEIIKSKLNVSYSEMIYVGDNPKKDFAAGNKLGIITMQIHRIHGIYSPFCSLKDYEPMMEIKSLDELVRYIKG